MITLRAMMGRMSLQDILLFTTLGRILAIQNFCLPSTAVWVVLTHCMEEAMVHGLALPMPCDSDENKFYITMDDWKERACVKKKIAHVLPRVFDCQH